MLGVLFCYSSSFECRARIRLYLDHEFIVIFPANFSSPLLIPYLYLHSPIVRVLISKKKKKCSIFTNLIYEHTEYFQNYCSFITNLLNQAQSFFAVLFVPSTEGVQLEYASKNYLNQLFSL